MFPRFVGSVVAALLAVSLSACASESQDARPQIVTGLYPLQFVVERIGGDLVAVKTLTPPNGHPHEVELTAQQVAEVTEADLVVYVQGLQPAVDEAVGLRSGTSIDAMTVVPATAGESEDPHMWLDPALLSLLADKVEAQLSEIAPESAAEFAENAATLRSDLATLDSDFKSATETCANRTLIVSHLAYGYLANAYDFEVVSVSGISPESEPSPARLVEVAQVVRELGATTVYSESALESRVADTIASETGATVRVLSPLESISGSDQNYLSVMRSNLDSLVAGQSCS